MQAVKIDTQKIAICDLYTKEKVKQIQDTWAPILQTISKETASIKTFKSEITPDGLVGHSSEGWSLAMCCFPTAQSPHFVGVRCNQENSQESRATALLQEGKYIVSTEGQNDEKLREILRKILLCLDKQREKKEPREKGKPSAKEVGETLLEKVRQKNESMP